jgi:hypothetical protein
VSGSLPVSTTGLRGEAIAELSLRRKLCDAGLSSSGDVLTVPVYVPSYDQSGDTHVVGVGDEVSWQLAVHEEYLPDHLLATIEASAAPAEPPYPASNYYPTLLREGSFVAWWDAGRPVAGRVELRAGFAIGDSRLPDEGVPEARGVVDRLFWALDLLRQRRDGPWDRVPGLGLVEVESTQVAPDQEGFTAYFPAAGVDANDGYWRHIGWIAMLRCS